MRKYSPIFVILAMLLSAYGFAPKKIKISLPTISPTPHPASPSQVKVTRVIDGDTIELDNGKKVRYIGIDSPELHHPTKPIQCFAKEAMEKNKELVEGKIVRLEKDISETDKYGRLLRFVYLDAPDSTTEAIFVNEYLVKQGFAHAATFPPDVKFSQLFLEDERYAREHNLGLWQTCQ